jgi:hypothetical protein
MFECGSNALIGSVAETAVESQKGLGPLVANLYALLRFRWR